MKHVWDFGPVAARERDRADLFYESLTGRRASRSGAAPFDETYEQAPAVVAQAAYGRAYTPQPGVFNCALTNPLVVPASLLPERTTDPAVAIDTALTAAGLNATQRGRITRPGLVPIAAEFGAPALGELFARLRWSAADFVRWGAGARSMLVARLLIHVPGHFRELARRAPDAREAFALECLGWLLMAHLRNAVASATRDAWWVPPAPAFVTAVPNPIPPMSAEVSRLFLRYLLVDTTMPAAEWNGRLSAWGTSLAGRQWQAEVGAPQPGRPFYATLVTIPAHVNTATARASLATAWTQRRADTDAANSPLAATAAAVTLAGLRNAVALRECDDANPHLPAGVFTAVDLQGLELATDFPQTRGRVVTRLTLLSLLRRVYTELFRAIRELGWNDLLYQTGGGGCFRGIRHPAAARVTVGGVSVLVDPFHRPDATTVARVNANFTAAQRTRALRAVQSARRMSEHSLGAAIDFNVPENEQDTAARPFGSMDPRLVAIFEAFHFRFGGCFGTTDPMHFEYCQSPCAPAAANAGALGPVVTPRLLVPAQATPTPATVLA